MTNNPNTVASCGELQLSTEEFLRTLHLRRDLVSSLIDAVTEKVILTEAVSAGIHISDEALQQAADDFRQRHGLSSAEQTHNWLREHRLSLRDFQELVERSLLKEKFIDHKTSAQITDYFTAHQTEFDRLQLCVLVVHREDLAQELLTQIYEDGQEFTELARQHSVHPSGPLGGLQPEIHRHQLKEPLDKELANAKAGDIVGPIPTPEGFQLVLVHAITSGELSSVVSEHIRKSLFDTWLTEYVTHHAVTMPILERVSQRDSLGQADDPA